MENNEIAEELLRSVWTDNRIDNDQYVIHKNRVESIVKQLQNTSSNSDYAKCKIEAEIKRLEENPEGDYVTRISALEWALRIVAERCTKQTGGGTR